MSESEKSLFDSKENVLKELLLTYGIDSTETQRRQLLKHIELLIEINKNLNLTRITSIDDALVLHILDSLYHSKYVMSFYLVLTTISILVPVEAFLDCLLQS